MRPVGSAIELIRAATAAQHAQLECRLDAVAKLADPGSRHCMVKRYAALHIPADAALAPFLEDLAELDFPARSRVPLLRNFAGTEPLPTFPRPADRAEALGLLYVLEGSALGGRLILRQLAERNVEDPDLAFLDPYGSATSTLWRGFLAVLANTIGDHGARREAACRGAQRGFAHAEEILCGGHA